ncbi:MAG: FAD/FMN-containing dehydrogenase [Gammaproteobacteria bacterium]|jgi:FAD/FMN-containing dehydrogenase
MDLVDGAVARELLDAVRNVVGPAGLLTDIEDMAPYLEDQRGLYVSKAPFVVRPANTEEVSEVVKLCARAGVGIVPQGGNTGLVGGSVPDDSGRQIVLSLARMNRVRDLDRLNFTAVIEAGCVLTRVQEAADEAQLLFPLSLASEGSCQLGGNLSTNAGGTAVLRYGNARDLVLGLEVVLANGEIWNGLRTLRKDNTGYDLKHLFLGSEGTLGIITAAAIKLFPRPAERCTAIAAVESPAAATALLGWLRDAHGDAVTTYEYMQRLCIDMVLEQIPGTRDPLQQRYEHYLLVEVGAPGADTGIGERFEQTLAGAFDKGWVLDASVAASGTQREEFWRLRESIPEATKLAGAGIKHDIAVALTDVSAFIDRGSAAVRNVLPSAKLIVFGHLGDGNLHFNLNQPDDMSAPDFLGHSAAVSEVVHDLAVEFSGSFSAEHGVGRVKRNAVERYKSPVEIELMRSVKRALDPQGLLNPGKVLAPLANL